MLEKSSQSFRSAGFSLFVLRTQRKLSYYVQFLINFFQILQHFQFHSIP